jgi:ABC-type lipoprotein export system ATPase subunit
MIEAKNLIKTFPALVEPVLKDLNLKIFDGDFISLVGKSGSGKSTLLYILSTLDNPTSGEVHYDHSPIQNFSKTQLYELRNKQIGFVFQFHYLISELSAQENVLLPTRKTNQQFEKRNFARELIKAVGLSGKEDRYPGELSGGEQQRLAIARALIMNPKYIFADEPTGNLDSANGTMVMDLFKKFNQTKETTIIYVTHDREFASLASKSITLVDGRIQSSLIKN